MTFKRKQDLTVHDSSGNVFADLGLPCAEEDMLKVKIAHAITVTVRRRGLTQAEAGRIIKVDQAKVSALLRGRLRGFSVERLVLFLVALGRDVDIMISKEHAHREGRIRGKAAA
jgi:predicted XRE-type DNA-binding protein